MICRCCGGTINGTPLVEFPVMPKSAQYLPGPDELETDTSQPLQVYQCPFCGIVQLAGEPVPYYREVIRATGISPSMQRFRREQFSQWLTRYNLRGKKIIEIGCGSGEFMDIMKAAGGYVAGIEYGAKRIDVVKGKGYQAWKMAIEDENTILPEAPYDAFYMMSFLEHNPHPREYLQAIYNNLKDNAVGIVEVPNADIILNDGLYAEFIQDHLLYFTNDTFRRLLEWSGFEVISCKSIWHNYILSAEVKKRPLYDMSGFKIHEKHLLKNIKEFLADMKKQNRIIAVWGAGHQALANLAILGIRDDISYVLDSAPFKQGKYTPATHIPIISPNEIKNAKIGSILIMAGSYTSEILQILRNDFPDIIRAILDGDEIHLDM